MNQWQDFQAKQSDTQATDNFVCAADELGLILVNGVDATDFLQNQLSNDINNFCISQIWAVFLKCQTQYSNLSATHPVAMLHQSLNRLLSHKLSHIVVCLASSQNNLRMMANRLCLIRQIVGVDTNTVASDQARPKMCINCPPPYR